MIQSPRGSINFPAHTSFDQQATPRQSDTPLTPTQIHRPLHSNNIDSSNQLVRTNPIRSLLNPQITRQVAYSEKNITSHGTVSKNSIRSEAILGIESNSPSRMETMVFYIKNGDNATRQYRSR